MPHAPIVSALLAYARTLDEWVRPTTRRRKLRASVANAFVLGVVLDRSVLAPRAWDAAEWINDALGDESDVSALWRSLASLEKRRLTGFLRYGYGGKVFHRHYKTFARQLPQVARHLLEHYDGDPRRIWNGMRDVEAVRARLDDIPGIGMALSRMAVLMLARQYGLLGGIRALPALDVKPDIHVMRVFRRCGLISPRGTRLDAVRAAREHHPAFPAALDAPGYDIGRTWCRPTRPRCDECPLRIACPRIGVTPPAHTSSAVPGHATPA